MAELFYYGMKRRWDNLREKKKKHYVFYHVNLNNYINDRKKSVEGVGYVIILRASVLGKSCQDGCFLPYTTTHVLFYTNFAMWLYQPLSNMIELYGAMCMFRSDQHCYQYIYYWSNAATTFFSFFFLIIFDISLRW